MRGLVHCLPRATCRCALRRSRRSGSPPARFDLVGLHWRGPGTVLFRTRSLAGRWSAWRAADPEDDCRPRHGGRRSGWRLGSPFWTGAADALQVPHGRAGRTAARLLRFGARDAPVRRARPLIAEHADDHPARGVGRERGDPTRGRRVYADGVHFAIVHHTAGLEQLHARPVGRDRAGDRGLPRQGATAGTTSATTSSSTSTARSSKAGTAA